MSSVIQEPCAEETGAKKTNTYSLLLHGTNESQDMQQTSVINQFVEGCQTPHSYLDGPSVLGLEVEKNARIGVDRIIEWLKKEPLNDEFNVNLAGFSRGAVTAIRIANYLEAYINELKDKKPLSEEDQKLLQKLDALKLNIFAVDPVAGITAKGVPESCIIPPIVNEYIAVFHIHEMRPDFIPQDMTRLVFASPDTKRALLPLYDVHSGSSRVEKDRESTGHLLWSMLYSFLTTHGSSYSEIPAFVDGTGKEIQEEKEVSIPIYKNGDEAEAVDDSKSKKTIEHSAYKTSNAYLCNEFALHHLQKENCAKAGQAVTLVDGLPMPKVQRRVARQLEYYVMNSRFFVNKLERELFKITYPKTFNDLFENGLFDSRFPNKSGNFGDVQEELKRMEIESPYLYSYLTNENLIAYETKASKFVLFPQHPGTPLLESFSAVELIYPDKIRALNFNDESKAKNKALNEVEALIQNIYSATFQYQRKKAGHDIFKKNAEHLRVKAIRKEVSEILERGGEPEVVKQALLVLVYKHSLLLHSEDSKSRCLKLLDNILIQHKEVPFSPTQNSAMTSCIRAGFKVLDESIYFISTGAYVGGAALSATGLFLKRIGKRIEDLNTGTNTAGGKDGASSAPVSTKAISIVASTAISMISKGLIAIGNVFNAHFGIKVGREALRAGLRDSKHGFFAKTIHSVDGNIKELTLVGVEAMLEQLGKVDQYSPKRIIARHNALQEKKADLIDGYDPKIISKERRGKSVDDTTGPHPLEFSCSA